MADEVGQADALSILGAHKEQYRSVQVNKDIGVHYDSGNLMVSDVNLLDNDALRYVALQHPANILHSFTLLFPCVHSTEGETQIRTSRSLLETTRSCWLEKFGRLV